MKQSNFKAMVGIIKKVYKALQAMCSTSVINHSQVHGHKVFESVVISLVTNM